MRVSSLRAIELAIPLIRPFRNAGTTIRERRIVLVEVRSAVGVVGWGEAAPFPGATADDVDAAWASLTSGRVDSLTPSAHAGYDEARRDAAARAKGVPLWQALGGSGAPVEASLAIGLGGGIDETLAAVAAATTQGYRAVKLKLVPARTALVEEVRKAFPDLAIGIDCNGSFRPDQAEALAMLDRWKPAYLEQPFPVAASEACAALRGRVETPIVLDEDIVDAAAARACVEAGAADVLTVKPGRLGIGGALDVRRVALDAGLGVKVSGLIETGVGRGHVLAMATLPGTIHADIAPAQAFLENDVAGDPWMVRDGGIEPRSVPGIGVEPDADLIERYAAREAVAAVSGDRSAEPG